MSVHNRSNNHCSWFAGLMLSVFVCFSVQAQEPMHHKIAELIAHGDTINGQTTAIQGEIIGDIMPRQKGYVWFNVQDSTSVLGVWARGDLARQILVAGDYNYQGDEVEVVGVFAKADQELSGETCIRAQSIDILKRGHRSEHVFNPVKARVALILSILAGVLLVLRMTIQRRG